MAWVALWKLTVAHTIRQPATWLAAGLGASLLLLAMLFGMFNFEEQDRLRLLSTAGAATTMLVGLFLAVVTASKVINDELSSRTALTLFAKPMSRWSFLLGKALGAWGTAAAVVTVLALMHLSMVWYFGSFGFHGEGNALEFTPLGRVFAAHVLVLANTLVMSTLAAALALRLNLIGNIIICFGIFVLAHLLGGSGFATTGIGPALSLFAIDYSLQFPEHVVSIGYLALSLGHAVLYSAAMLFLGQALFLRQDIP
jgi:ABC-type transport system involved in multi-copper enzyme maturation permease subunit